MELDTQTPSLDNSCSSFVRGRVAGPSIEMTLVSSQVVRHVLSRVASYLVFD